MYGQDISSPAIINRSRSFINTVVDNNLVKYNDGKCIEIEIDTNKENILIVDQVKDDMSLSLGQCDVYRFDDMIAHALDQRNAKVFVKLHPETSQGVKDANFDIESLRNNENITLIEDNCNMMHLLKQIDQLYVMTSGAGLDALMAGKKVTCFGNPFYAGWGLTIDMQAGFEKGKTRTIEEIVAAVYFKQTLWFDPFTREECSPEDAIDALIRWKKNN
jgi:capsular polysaccharide export protein